ncbi:hypothetical protein COY05_04630 [Candidatus Peregrinibacteria bacterium CG_4_10_14_0_2_um_filter_38_24]|nr:MAG: hypothetical protein COY05_04630 [Candidatus Peregrinibacteria bacterium CG_4_10_14_0_2_um_filter_38_24]
MGIDNAEGEIEKFEFSRGDVGNSVSLDGCEVFAITDVLSDGMIELACRVQGWKGLGILDRFSLMRGVAEDELYNEYRFPDGTSLKIEIKGVDESGRKILVASVIEVGEVVGIL